MLSGTPTVLATLEHQRDGIKHDAASVWIEDVTSSSFQVCIRELQNFDGIHQDIEVVSKENKSLFCGIKFV